MKDSMVIAGVKIVRSNGELWLSGKDVINQIGYITNSFCTTLKKKLKPEEIAYFPFKNDTIYINESAIYYLVERFNSKFKREISKIHELLVVGRITEERYNMKETPTACTEFKRENYGDSTIEFFESSDHLLYMSGISAGTAMGISEGAARRYVNSLPESEKKICVSTKTCRTVVAISFRGLVLLSEKSDDDDAVKAFADYASAVLSALRNSQRNEKALEAKENLPVKKEEKSSTASHFWSEEFGTIRTLAVSNEPWFVGKDICNAFGDSNYRRTLLKVYEEDKRKERISTSGGSQSMVLVNESGLYSILFSMNPRKGTNSAIAEERIEKLNRFKRWVTHDVIPSIRKTGGYGTTNEDETFMSKYLSNVSDETKEALKSLLKSIQEDKKQMLPVETPVQKLTLNDFGIPLFDVCKSQGIPAGYVYRDLREKGIIKGNLPVQEYIDKGYFKIIEKISTHGKDIQTYFQTVVTKSGLAFIRSVLK